MQTLKRNVAKFFILDALAEYCPDDEIELLAERMYDLQDTILAADVPGAEASRLKRALLVYVGAAS
jgi:hypothetical protein